MPGAGDLPRPRTASIPGPAPYDELAMGLPGTDHGIPRQGLSRALLALQAGKPLALDQSSARDRSEIHLRRYRHPAPRAPRLHHAPGAGRLRRDGPARGRFMGRGRHGDDSGRLVLGLRCGHDLQGMAWTGAPRARTRRVRSRAEILAHTEVGPALAA